MKTSSKISLIVEPWGGVVKEGGFCIHPSLSTLCSSSQYRHLFIWSPPQTGSRKLWSRKYQMFSMLCRSDVVSRSSYLTRSPCVQLPTPSPIRGETVKLTACQLQLQLTWTRPYLKPFRVDFTIDQFVPQWLLTVSQVASRHNPGFPVG